MDQCPKGVFTIYLNRKASPKHVSNVFEQTTIIFETQQGYYNKPCFIVLSKYNVSWVKI